MAVARVLPFMDTQDLATQIEQTGRALTAPELAKLLGFGRSTLYEMTKSGRIPYIRISTSIRYDCFQIATWLRARTVPTAI